MGRWVLLLVACLGWAGAALAGAPPPETIQGLYEGACKDAKGECKLEARVVACGHATYKVFVRQMVGEKSAARIELDGKSDEKAVRFTGSKDKVEWIASYADGAIKGTCGQGATLELKRVVRPSPTLGEKPPQGAIVLLDGKNFDEVTKKPAASWKLTGDGAVHVPKGGMNSKRRFDGSFKLHVEFLIPLMPDARGQGRGNSGVYLPNGDEIQVLDSFGMTTYRGGGCGGAYAYKDPDAFDQFSLASAPPLEWQTYDIEYRVQKKGGKPAGKPRVTVVHNGIKIHDNVEVHMDAHVGGLHFQDHGNPVQYRNIWLLPIEAK